MKKLSLSTIVIKFKENWSNPKNELLSQRSILISFVLTMGLSAFWIQNSSNGDPSPMKNRTTQARIDTLIPDDKTLIPIRVINYESLDQIIGNHGVVDLYSAPEHSGQKSRLIATSVQLLNISENEGYFNVLIASDQAPALTAYSGEFIVGIRNPNLVGTEIVKEKSVPKKRRVFYASEDE